MWKLRRGRRGEEIGKGLMCLQSEPRIRFILNGQTYVQSTVETDTKLFVVIFNGFWKCKYYEYFLNCNN